MGKLFTFMLPYALATISGFCFFSGITVLSYGKEY